ncbi:release factor glutamine methyltransferase [Brevibacterium siliguriense]|uniref:Release factor glutamine methyltransferase n=1 Tax=Brevibacterium siliguriense TaxID=1136497 RepID=A0A1H1S6Y3_9MICO|nr:methyltransferase [Brevibacterium siliguriense]SDS43745.1 release factor glutamine methyltransferase [Brevibacterium siliguriense]
METLRAAGCVFAEDEAAILIEAAAGFAGDGSVPAVDASTLRLDELATRRVAGEPLEQIVGWVDFAGMRLQVRPGLFVPRQRSRLLAERAVAAVRQVTDQRGSSAESGARTVPRPDVLEAFCGVGPVASAVAASVPEAAMHVGDADEQAVRCAVTNVEASARAEESGAAVSGHALDCLHGLPDELRCGISVIAAVPPYVPVTAVDFLPREALDFEPSTALFGGPDGLDLVRRLMAESLDWLAPDGVLLIELGRDQAAEATGFATERGLEAQNRLGEDDQTVVLELRRGHRN